jgi:hypothetical protein
MAERRLAGDESHIRGATTGVRRWDGNEHLALYSPRLLLEKSEGIRAGSTQPRVEHDATCQHELEGIGTVPGG